MKNFNLKAQDWALALEEIQKKSGHEFKNRELLRVALTHASYASESPEPHCQWNERLEFLGDAVLQVLISTRLYNEMPDVQEGELTRARSLLVDEPANARNANLLGLVPALMLGKGENLSGGRERQSIQGDLLEAFLGAVYLDGGLQAASDVVDRLYPDIRAFLREAETNDNPKGLLQHYCQHTLRGAPKYETLSADGPCHAPHFVCQVTLPDGAAFQGEGTTKKAAEQEAARKAILEQGVNPSSQNSPND